MRECDSPREHLFLVTTSGVLTGQYREARRVPARLLRDLDGEMQAPADVLMREAGQCALEQGDDGLEASDARVQCRPYFR